MRLKLAGNHASGPGESPWNVVIGAITVVTAGVAIFVTLFFAFGSSGGSGFHLQPSTSSSEYPTGVKSSTQPSGQAPPGASALAGYTLSYVKVFDGTSLPPGWNVFTGVPRSDPGGKFALNHVVVSGGLLHLITSKDSLFHNRWVTGGLCQCEVARTYGAYFVRSRVTGPGANEVELLWPKTNIWPPEVDFNETGGSIASTSSTVHFNVINTIEQKSVRINMEQWHTWGVIWTPASLSYVVDGQVWGVIKSTDEIPKVPMTLDFEQRVGCGTGRECPSHPVSMLVNWVAEYVEK